MALNFPNNPALNDTYTVDQKTWLYTGTAWNVVSGNVNNVSATSSFTNIAVAGQTTVAADTATDTLTLVAGSGIAITTNAATDTVTLTSVASTGNITIADTTLSVSNANPITITPNLVLGGTLRFPDNTVQTTATLQGPPGAPGASGSGSGNVNSVLGNYVDNALIRYSGTSGTTIKVSAASINDSGLLTAVNFSGGGANITSLNADNLTTGTVADARFPATLPAVSGANLTALNATNLGSGTVPVLRLGTAGTRDATTYLRGDNTWATVAGGGAASDSFATIAVAGQSNVVADSATDTLTLVAGSNITITTNAGTDTITIAGSGGAASDSFATIAVAGQSNVVAESATDTLTLVAGSNVTITTNATTDTITISSVGASGATALIDLSDVSAAGLTVDEIYLSAITRLVVTPNGSSSYSFDQYSATNPTIYAISGTTIAFDISAVTGSHPFLIQTSGGTNYDTGLIHVSTTGVISTGSAAQGKTSGTLYWKIPEDTTGNYRYRCSNHGGMAGVITITPGNNIGYLNIPQNSQSAAYTLTLADSGKHIFHPADDANARTYTIPANSSVAYPIGTALTFINMTTQVVTIAINTDTMYLSGTGTTGSRTLAQYGSASAIKITSTSWLVSGSGLT